MHARWLVVVATLAACGTPAPPPVPPQPPPAARDAAPAVVDTDLTASVMDDLVAQANGRLAHGDDAPCAGDAARPHFYTFETDGTRELVTRLFERCTAIGPHRAQNLANWCCPALPLTGADACATDRDCTRGYHGADLTGPADCGCRACPIAPQTHAVAKRRDEQYGRHCTPNVTAAGHRCPVAGCAAPAPTRCHFGMCVSP